MASTHKPFRELVKPGTNFEFVGRSRVWALVSTALIIGSISMLFVNKAARGDYLNWTIDFKGGTEVIVAFRDKESNDYTAVSSGDVRAALAKSDDPNVRRGFEVSGFGWEVEGRDAEVPGILIRTPSFGAVSTERKQAVADAFRAKFEDREILKVNWSGDRMFARTKQTIQQDEAKAFFAEQELEMKPWSAKDVEAFASAEEGTGEYNAQFGMRGLDRTFAQVLEDQLGVTVELIQSYAVGAKAGAKLRNDGIKSMFYVIALIMLYLAFRFDVRYAPGAVAALLHDAILVTGAFAVTWMDVSLTSVAALLTVIGYSVNDTVVIFDRIRENVGRLKDKKMARVINISLNETMARTLLTSITLFVVTLSLNIFGTGLVSNFAFAMNVGVVVGVYSSVFVASPVMLYLDTRYYAKRRRIERTRRPSSSASKKKPGEPGKKPNPTSADESEAKPSASAKPSKKPGASKKSGARSGGKSGAKARKKK